MFESRSDWLFIAGLVIVVVTFAVVACEVL
jgi:hypothetical protein